MLMNAPPKVRYKNKVLNVAADCGAALLNLIIRRDNAVGPSQDEKLTGHIKGPQEK